MENDTLVLVHAIFRHGERTPDSEYLYPKDPYLSHDFAPYGSGQLTNLGKKTMYDLGLYLRERYDSYLGSTYHPDIVDCYTTRMDRTKTSLQLVCASLFEPQGDQIWHDNLKWQPVPFTSDSLLMAPVLYSEEYLKEYRKHFVTHGQDILKRHSDLMTYLKEHSGLECDTTRDTWALAASLSTEANFGLMLPEWAKSVFPKQLMDMLLIETNMQTATKELRQLAVGNIDMEQRMGFSFEKENVLRDLLTKILDDTKQKIMGMSKCKLHLYSGHEFNISNVLKTLQMPLQRPPQYGACLIFEVHRIQGEYGIKVFFKESKLQEAKLLKIPTCDEVCTVIKFSEIINEACGYV